MSGSGSDSTLVRNESESEREGVVHCDDSESGDFGRSEYDSIFKGVGNRHEVTQKHKASNALSVNLSDHGREEATALKQPSWPLTFHKEPAPFDQRGCGG